MFCQLLSLLAIAFVFTAKICASDRSVFEQLTNGSYKDHSSCYVFSDSTDSTLRGQRNWPHISETTRHNLNSVKIVAQWRVGREIKRIVLQALRLT